MESTLRDARLECAALLQLENALGYPRLESALLTALLRKFDALENVGDLAGVVITGTPQAFAVGAEIAEIAALDPAEAFRFSRLGQNVLTRIERFPKPVIAAIRGYCFGGGLDLALACHVRIAADDARFTHPGGSLGIFTGWGGTARLPRTIGRGPALEILTTGRVISAAEALAKSLVRRVLPADEVIGASLDLLRRRPGEVD